MMRCINRCFTDGLTYLAYLYENCGLIYEVVGVSMIA